LRALHSERLEPGIVPLSRRWRRSAEVAYTGPGRSALHPGNHDLLGKDYRPRRQQPTVGRPFAPTEHSTNRWDNRLQLKCKPTRC